MLTCIIVYYKKRDVKSFFIIIGYIFGLSFIYSKKSRETPLFKCTFNQMVPTFIAFYSTFHHIKGYYIIEVFYDTVKVAFSLPADSQTTIR